MSVSTSEFNTETIGSWSDPDEFVVERDRIKAYAAATNDPFEVHQSGDIAPPVFAVVPAFGALAATSTSVIPPDALMMVLHGEQDFHFHQPIRPDTTLVTRAVALGVQPRSSGVTVNVKGETRDKDSDELIVEQYMISFVRAQQVDEGVGEEPLPHGFDEALRSKDPDAEIAQTYDEDQTFRYAEAAGDPMPIHLDDEIAKAMGFPGIIIHGLCTMAFTSRGQRSRTPARTTRRGSSGWRCASRRSRCRSRRSPRGSGMRASATAATPSRSRPPRTATTS